MIYQSVLRKLSILYPDDATLLGRPEGFKVTINDLIPNTGSGFLVAISGNIMRMPGLPKVPAANNMDIDEEGKIMVYSNNWGQFR